MKGPTSKYDMRNVVYKINLAYIQGTNDKISHIVKKKNITTPFKFNNTIGTHLKHDKYSIDPTNKKLHT